jgi:hypothetical protein
MVLGEKNMDPITNQTPTNDNTSAPQPVDPAAMPVMDPPVTPPAPVAEAPAPAPVAEAPAQPEEIGRAHV